MGIEVHWRVDTAVSPSRIKTGWSVPTAPGVRIDVLGEQVIEDMVQADGPGALHMFAARGIRSSSSLLGLALRRRINYGLIAERPNGRFARRAIAWMYYRYWAKVLPQPRAFLALGDKGADFYRSAGYINVFPFWYTVPASSHDPELAKDDTATNRRLIVVARLFRLKRVDLVLRALANINRSFSLQIVGDGPERAALEWLSQALGLSNRVVFRGALPSAQAREAIRCADTLVLASEWEGWGAVVNEAIAEGTRVVVSRACGASCLAALAGDSEAFDANNKAALASALLRQIDLPGVSAAERRARMARHERISGAAAAKYLLDILEQKTPCAPWSGENP